MNKFCGQGWQAFLNAAVDKGLVAKIRLFQNDWIPTDTDTEADYIEADFSGYFGPTALTWGLAFVNSSNQGEIDAAQVTWVHDGGSPSNTVYGVYVTDSFDKLTYAERFPAPLVFANLGDQLQYNPAATLIDQ